MQRACTRSNATLRTRPCSHKGTRDLHDAAMHSRPSFGINTSAEHSSSLALTLTVTLTLIMTFALILALILTLTLGLLGECDAPPGQLQAPRRTYPPSAV